MDYWMAFVSTDGKLLFLDDERTAWGEPKYVYDGITGGLVDLTAGSWSGDAEYDYGAATEFKGTGWYTASSIPEPRPLVCSCSSALRASPCVAVAPKNLT